MNGTAIPILAAVLIFNTADVLAPFLDGASREGRKGNERYAARDWEHAMEHYGKAAAARENGAMQYNLGTAAYQKKDYRTAASALGRAASDAKTDRARADYNLGNTRFRTGDLRGALDAYRAALCQNPQDADARANFELALKQLKSSPPDSSQKKSQNKSGDNSKDNSQKQSSSSKGDNSQPSQPSSSPDANPKNSSGAPDSSQTGQPQPPQQQPKPGQPNGADSSSAKPQDQGGTPLQPGQMTAAEAKQLLNAVTPEERELLQARLKPTHKRRAEKDW
jgi:Ca-activated chloride channel homolog